MATTLNDLLNLGGTVWDYYNKKGNIQDTSKNVNQAFNKAGKTITQYQAPYVNAGLEALQGYQGMGPFQFDNNTWNANKDPSYDWRLNQGLQGVERSQAAKGGYFSGQTLTSLNDYAQGAASQEYQSAFNRANTSFNTNQKYYGDIVKTGAATSQNLGENLANLGLGNTAVQGGLDQQKADLFDQALNSLGIATNSGMASSIFNAADGIAKQLFGTGLKDLGNEYVQPVIDKTLEALGLGSTVGSGSSDILGQGIYGGMTGNLQDIGGKTFDSATGQWLNTGTSTAISLAEPAIGTATAIGTYTGNGIYQTADGFLLDMGTGTTAAAQGAATAGTGLEAATSFLSSAPGMGIIAAGATLLMGGDIKSAAVTGGLTYAGAAIGSVIPGIGTLIGGAIGGLVGSLVPMGGYAKADTVMMQSTSTDGFKHHVYAEGPWGNIGFKGSATRHLDNINKQYKPIFDVAAGMDQMVSVALTPEENQAVKDAFGSKYTYRKESNEGKISPKKVLNGIFNERKSILRRTLGDQRYQELQLDDLYSSALKSLSGKGK